VAPALAVTLTRTLTWRLGPAQRPGRARRPSAGPGGPRGRRRRCRRGQGEDKRGS